jgi:uncharacterized protein
MSLAGCGLAPLATSVPDVRAPATATDTNVVASPASAPAAEVAPISQAAEPGQPAAPQSAPPSPAPGPAVAPTPASIRLGPLTYIRQTLNNCGPASIAEVLNFWGVQRSQAQAQAVLRPDGNSRGMMPYPVPAYVKAANMNVIMGVNGTPTIVKALVANGFPVIVAQLVSVQEPIAHYREIEGFDDMRQVFVSTDSYLGPNHEISYGEFNQLWARGNQRFMVIYPTDKAALLDAVMKSVGWDQKAAYQADLARLERGENPMQQQPPGYGPGPNIPGSRELSFAWDYMQLGQLDQARAEIAKAPSTSRNQQMIGWLNQALGVYAA